MIKSISDASTRQFLENGKSKFSGLDESLAYERLSQLDGAISLRDMGRLNSVGLHKLKGALRNFWSVDVNGRWRIIFRFQDGHAYEVQITDTH